MWLDTPDTDAFRQAITANPEDRLPRLVYADYIEENARGPADSAYAAFTRLQCAAAETADKTVRQTIEAEYTDFFLAHWIDWWGTTCRVAGLPFPRRRRTGFAGMVRRVLSLNAPDGAPYEIPIINSAGSPPYLVMESDHLLEPFPAAMPEVRFKGSGVVPDGVNVAAQYSLGHPDTLYVGVRREETGTAGVPREFLVRWASRFPLRRLTLNCPQMSTGGIQPGDLPTVTELELRWCAEPVVHALLRAGVLPGVRTIKLHAPNERGEAGRQAATLLASPVAANCHTLVLGLNDDSQAQALRMLGNLANLERLVVFLPHGMPHQTLGGPYPTEAYFMFARLLQALAEGGLPPVLSRLTVAFPNDGLYPWNSRSRPEIDAAIGRLWAALRQRNEAELTIFHPSAYMTENLPAPRADSPRVIHRPLPCLLV
jgi:uncharacterized protein (TIGR02996 family)